MRVPVALWVNVALLAMLGAIVSPSLAVALEPGVHIDPGSPAAKEYALPLSQARQTGEPASSGGGASGALFGAGIGPRRSSGAPHPDSGTSRRQPIRNRDGGDSAARAPRGASTDAALARSAPGGSGSLLAVLGGAVLILAFGTVGGVVLRGRRSAHYL